MRPVEISAGGRYGILTVLNDAGYVQKDRPRKMYNCLCDCGNQHLVEPRLLIKGMVKSCGCMKYRSTHKASHTRLYSIWKDMKSRCYGGYEPIVKNYGRRGIVMCEEWRVDFAAFRDWALANCYDDTLTIERKNHEGNYEPSNCCWIPRQEQTRNTRFNVYVTAFGETKLMCDWVRDPRCNVTRACINHRLKHGFTPEAAIATPSKKPGVRRPEGYYNKRKASVLP